MANPLNAAGGGLNFGQQAAGAVVGGVPIDLEAKMRLKLGAFVHGGVLERLERLIDEVFSDGTVGKERQLKEALDEAKTAFLFSNVGAYGPVNVPPYSPASKAEPEFKAFTEDSLSSMDGWLVKDRLRLNVCKLEHAYIVVAGQQRQRVEWEANLVIHMAELLNIDLYFALVLWMRDRNLNMKLYGSDDHVRKLFNWAIKPQTAAGKAPVDPVMKQIFQDARKELQARLVRILDHIVAYATMPLQGFRAQEIIRDYVFKELNGDGAGGALAIAGGRAAAPAAPRTTLAMVLIQRMSRHPTTKKEAFRFAEVDIQLQGVLLRLVDANALTLNPRDAASGARQFTKAELEEALRLLLLRVENDAFDGHVHDGNEQKLATLLCVVLHSLFTARTPSSLGEYRSLESVLFDRAPGAKSTRPRGILGVCQIAFVASMRVRRTSDYFQPRAAPARRRGVVETDSGRWFDGMIWLAHCLLRWPALQRHAIGASRSEENSRTPQSSLSSKLSKCVSHLLAKVIRDFALQNDGCDWDKLCISADQHVDTKPLCICPFLRAVTALSRIADLDMLLDFFVADTSGDAAAADADADSQQLSLSLLDAATSALERIKILKRDPLMTREESKMIVLDTLNMVDAVSRALVRLDSHLDHDNRFDDQGRRYLASWAHRMISPEVEDSGDCWSMQNLMHKLQIKSRDIHQHNVGTLSDRMLASARLRTVASSVLLGVCAEPLLLGGERQEKWDDWMIRYCREVFINTDARNQLENYDGPTALIFSKGISEYPLVLTELLRTLGTFVAASVHVDLALDERNSPAWLTWRALRELGDFVGWMRDCLMARNHHEFVPQTTAFVALLQQLLLPEFDKFRPKEAARTSSPPELGRPSLTELQSYVDFTVEDVFMKWDNRGFPAHADAWQVCAESLGVINIILEQYTAAGDHVRFEVARELRSTTIKKRRGEPAATSGRRSRQRTPVRAEAEAQPWSIGFDLLVNLLCSPRRSGSPLLLKIIGVLTYAVAEDTAAAGSKRSVDAASNLAADALNNARSRASMKGAPTKPAARASRARRLDELRPDTLSRSSELLGGNPVEWEWITWRERAVERALRVISVLVRVQDQFIAGVADCTAEPIRGDLALSRLAFDRLGQLEPVSPSLFGGSFTRRTANAGTRYRRRAVANQRRNQHPLEHVASWTKYRQRGSDGIARYALSILAGLSVISSSATGAGSGTLAMSRVFSDGSRAASLLTASLSRRMNATIDAFQPQFWSLSGDRAIERTELLLPDAARLGDILPGDTASIVLVDEQRVLGVMESTLGDIVPTPLHLQFKMLEVLHINLAGRFPNMTQVLLGLAPQLRGSEGSRHELLFDDAFAKRDLFHALLETLVADAAVDDETPEKQLRRATMALQETCMHLVFRIVSDPLTKDLALHLMQELYTGRGGFLCTMIEKICPVDEQHIDHLDASHKHVLIHRANRNAWVLKTAAVYLKSLTDVRVDGVPETEAIELISLLFKSLAQIRSRAMDPRGETLEQLVLVSLLPKKEELVIAMKLEGEKEKEFAGRNWGSEVIEVGPRAQRGRARTCGDGHYEHVNFERLNERLNRYGNGGGAFGNSMGRGGGFDGQQMEMDDIDDVLQRIGAWNICSHCIVSYRHLIEGWVQLVGVLLSCDGALLALCHAQQSGDTLGDGGGAGASDDKLCVIIILDRLLTEVLQRISSMPTMDVKSCELLSNAADLLTRKLFELIIFGPALELSDTTLRVKAFMQILINSRGKRMSLYTEAAATARLDAVDAAHRFDPVGDSAVTAENIDWKKILRSIVHAMLGIDDGVGSEGESTVLIAGRDGVRRSLYMALVNLLRTCGSLVPSHSGLGTVSPAHVADAEQKRKGRVEYAAKLFETCASQLATTLLRDATDLNNQGIHDSIVSSKLRRAAFRCLDSVLAHDPSGAVLQSIIDQGELRRMVGNLPVWAAAGMQFLDGPPTMPNAAEAASWSWRSAGRVHWIVLSHTLALLTRIAQSPRGAQALVHFGLPDKLAACSALSAHPICRRGEAAEVIITATALYHDVIVPALQLSHLLMVHVGASHATLRNDLVAMLISHKLAIESILESVLKRPSVKVDYDVWHLVDHVEQADIDIGNRFRYEMEQAETLCGLLVALSQPAVVGGGDLTTGALGIIAEAVDGDVDAENEAFLSSIERKLLEMFRKYANIRPFDECPDGSTDRTLHRVRDLPARDVTGATSSSRDHTIMMLRKLSDKECLRGRQLRLLSKSCSFLRRRAALGRGEWCAHHLLFLVPTDVKLRATFRPGVHPDELRPLTPPDEAGGGTSITSIVRCIYACWHAASRAEEFMRISRAAPRTTAARQIVEDVAQREYRLRVTIAENALLLLYAQLSHIAVARECVGAAGAVLQGEPDVARAAVHMRGAELERQHHSGLGRLVAYVVKILEQFTQSADASLTTTKFFGKLMEKLILLSSPY